MEICLKSLKTIFVVPMKERVSFEVAKKLLDGWLHEMIDEMVLIEVGANCDRKRKLNCIESYPNYSNSKLIRSALPLYSPSFDPNSFVDGISIEQYEELLANPAFPLNYKAIKGQYPPGSTFKIITALALL